MAAYGWRKNRSVIRGLYDEGRRFDFFQAVRLLEILAHPRASMGEDNDPKSEAVRFRSTIRFSFPASDIESVEAPSGDEPAGMEVNFMGLAGAVGPLPRSFSEEVVDKTSRKDTAARDFLDIFNHRLLSLFYRARRRFRLALHWGPPETSRIARVLFSFMGLETHGLRERMHMPDRSLLQFAGLFARQARSMVGLERVLETHFRVPVEIVPYRGRWYALPRSECSVIGTRGHNRVVGRNLVLGTRVWDQGSGVELVIGPLPLETFIGFLPVGGAYRALSALTRFYASDEFDFTARLTITAREVPELRLGDKTWLGWTTWLKTEELEEDDSQVRLSLKRDLRTEEHAA